jgi:hypothetical protein
MQAHDLALSAVAFVSEVLGTLSGFGSSTFFVPAASYFESIRLVLALTALLHCFGNFSKIFLFGRHFEWRPFFLLASPAIFLTGLGALFSQRVPVAQLEKVLGVVLMLIPLASLVLGKGLRKLPSAVAVVLSGLSGFSTGLIGTGGAIRGMALISFGLSKNAFVAVSASIDLGGDLLRAVIYLREGYMDWSQWFYIPLLGASAWLGSWAGKKILVRIKQTQFERIVGSFIFFSGLLMVLK